MDVGGPAAGPLTTQSGDEDHRVDTLRVALPKNKDKYRREDKGRHCRPPRPPPPQGRDEHHWVDTLRMALPKQNNTATL